MRFAPNLFRTGMIRTGMFRSDIGAKHAMFYDMLLVFKDYKSSMGFEQNTLLKSVCLPLSTHILSCYIILNCV